MTGDDSIWRTIRTYVPRAFPYLRPYRSMLWLTCGISLFGVLLGLAEPWPLAFLIDGVLAGEQAPGAVTRLVGSGTGRLIVFAVLFGFALTLLTGAVNVCNSYIQTRLEQRMILDFRSDLFAHVQTLSPSFHDGARKGQLMLAINGQAAAVGEIILSILPLVQAVLTLVGMVFIAYRLQPQLALLSLTVVPFVYYSTGYYGNRVEPELRRVRGMEGHSLSIVHEAMSMMRVIVAFGREGYEHGRFRDQGADAVDGRIRVTTRQTVFSLGVNLITAAGTAIVLGVGARYVVRQELSVGELLIVLSYVAAVYQPLEQISGTLAVLQERLIALEAAVNLLDTAPGVADHPTGVELEAVGGTVEFRKVAFSYPGRSHTLHDVSFRVGVGDVVALVGPTGAGKSTLISLIPRFFDVHMGQVLIDGMDVRQIRLASLREHVSIVLQEPMLFSGSILDNIRYGRLDATRDEVVAAARAANAHAFICKLPQRYKTQLGEGGARLSGGERQRISIARAFLKAAPIVILDEPTSSVDSKTESVILDALERLVEGRTTFMIAHRLATVRRATHILVVDEGRVVQQGTHDQLMALPGLYREMYEAQYGPNPARAATQDNSSVAHALNGRREALNGQEKGQGGPVIGHWVIGNGDRVRPGVPRPERRMDVNRATAAELATLPGVGPVTAQAIIDQRRVRGPYDSPADLLTVPGITASKLTRILRRVDLAGRDGQDLVGGRR